MNEFTAKLPETKSERDGIVVWLPATDNDFSRLAGVLTLTGKRATCRYTVEEFAADFGRGFVLKKIDAGTDCEEGFYSCCIGTHAKLCECKGFVYKGRCKHVAALALLVNAGEL